MDSEDDLFRVPAPTPYIPVDFRLRVPYDALTATIVLLRRAGRRESGLLWYGSRDPAGNGTVAYVVAPRQRMTWGNYSIPADALAQIVHRLTNGWKPLAQIHSHPGQRVEHSSYDDRMVSSRRILSIVFPSYGRWKGRFPSGIGIHEWQSDYWHLLDEGAADRRVVLVEGAVKVEDMR